MLNENTTSPAKPSAAGLTVPSSGHNSTSVTALANEAIVATEDAKGGEEGEGGSVAPFASFAPSNQAFIDTLFGNLPDRARPIIVAKKGDPQQGGWVPSDAELVAQHCKDDTNNYVNCASVYPDDDGTVAARKDCAAAYHMLVLDDVGTKVARDILPALPPTWELETSPGNFQLGYKLSPPIDDLCEVDALQQLVAEAGLTDRGALGMMRWVRLPNGINGKPAYASKDGAFRCRLHAWRPERSYSAKALRDAVGVPEKTAEPQSTKRPQSPPKQHQPGQVFFPKAAENPVLKAFKDRGQYKRVLSPGKHEVTCPWVDEHTDGLDTGAAYFEPNEKFRGGGFCCQHSHKDDYHIGQLLDHFGLSPVDGRYKALIRTEAGEMNAILASAEEVLVQNDGLYQSGGMIACLESDPVTGDVTIKPVNESGLTLALSAAADWERYDARKHEWVRCDPPVRHVNMLYKKESYRYLPKLRGLARQPYYTDEGQLCTTSGYDVHTQRFGAFRPTDFPTPGNSETAATDALDLLQALIAEFHFASEVDRAAAISAMMTAVTRPSYGIAPAFHVSAPSSGSGKSYLCETISLFASPSGSSRVSYPRTSEEATKAMLSLLLAAPAVIEFDDMDTDWLPHGTINRMLTAPSISDRILGVSKVATVSTSALVLGSGNNVGPLRDLARRVVTINLNAKAETPGMLTYNGNPVAELRANRGRYVSAVLTVIEAWKSAGSPKTSVSSIASYGGAWADYCRHPLIWLGLPDPATPLFEQMQADPDSDVLRALLEAWHRKYGEKAMELRQLLSFDYGGTDLEEALYELPVVEKGDINRSRLGHYFKRNRDRIVGELMLQKAEHSARNAWKVVKVERGIPASPPLPPSSPLMAPMHQSTS